MIGEIKGLPMDVFRPADGLDCTLGGFSSRVNRVTVTGIVTRENGWRPLAEGRVFTPSDDAPEAWLYLRTIGRPVWVVVPVCAARQGDALLGHLSRLMFGSNFAHTSDSRIRRVIDFYGAVAIHDRIERS